MTDMERLKGSAGRKIKLIRKAEGEKGAFWSHAIYLGNLGLLIAAPIVGGAYLGLWLDKSRDSFFWTPSLIMTGAVVGAVNAYLFLRE
ncbi:MAG: AtpZ/AtpI family protein [Deltaproteobacteria bacterium]|nr:AtpZ/AtpI family protein [Deltaproteobacteria bacterium]